MTATWTAEQIPDQRGRTVIVTGSNSGIGLEAARELARAGAHVVLACRDGAKAEQAERSIRGDHAPASVESLELDLASLASVREFAKAFRERHDSLHVLVNNAGIMAIPRRSTADGFEMQLGTNHLGHFALTGLLLDRLLETPRSRVVNVSSTAHKGGRIDFDDLNKEQGYSRWGAYGQSKLANLLFTYELQRRLEAGGHDCLSAACHPGWTATNLQYAGPRHDDSKWMERLADVANRIFGQASPMGALPTLYAATAEEVSGADYVGPGGFMEVWGHPVKVDSNARSRDQEAAGRLWGVSEELTGLRYDL